LSIQRCAPNNEGPEFREPASNASGQIVMELNGSQLGNGDQMSVSLANLPAGVYLIRLQTTNNQSYTQRIIKN
ncbi:MAG: T9SS type A sorting domain-containing protein, partial [Bacteroidota bacterium]